ncbi:Nucleotide-binding universal stress protein, UspA family [Kaistella treverensis]|uniref:Nucleotide-binding universal stress protein, UspA family n=1 Tax=Kaistella treverensis TaxID=631455 RepID=A0A1I3JNP6_9FLAO|nr:universal stress protein [Kaistella treverensis]SFI61525.1 Nucleotide-binding universal stress protein, UspA family [Kaistella treverensis]
MMSSPLKTLLVPTDFSAKAENALRLATEMAMRHGSKIIILHVVHTYYLMDRGGKQVIGSEIVQQSLDVAQLKLNEIRGALQQNFNIEIEIKLSTQGLTDSINELILEENVDLVVLGTSGKQDVKSFILGSNSYNILQYAATSVLLVPETFRKTHFKKILLPVRVENDLDEKAKISLVLAEKNEGGINLLGVADAERLAMIRKSYAEMRKVMQMKGADYVSEFKLCADNADEIVETAQREESDIIVLADQDENSWKSFMAENFFKKMINGTDVPLFIVKTRGERISEEPLTGFDVTLPFPG